MSMCVIDRARMPVYEFVGGYIYATTKLDKLCVCMNKDRNLYS